MTEFHETKVFVTDLESARRGLSEVLGRRLGLALPPSSPRGKMIAALAARRATRGGPKRALDFRYALDAVQWWQWAFETAAHNAEHGELSVHRYNHNSQRWVHVVEPLSGIGVQFCEDGTISSGGGAKAPATIFNTIVEGGDPPTAAEHFLGVGIGRWVYLRGAREAFPRYRWMTNSAPLRRDSGSPYVRAWLHTQDPYRWAPVHFMRGRSSCRRCAGATQDQTEANWAELSKGEPGSAHRLRRRWRPIQRRPRWYASLLLSIAKRRAAQGR